MMRGCCSMRSRTSVQRGERYGIEKGQVDANKCKKEKKGDKNGKI